MKKLNTEQKLAELTQSVENALAEIRSLATSPVEVKYGEKAHLLVHPLSVEDRVDVCCGHWGHTTVNYSFEGVIVDVYSGEDGGFELVHTAAIAREELDGQAAACRQEAELASKTVTWVVPARAVSEYGDGPYAASIELSQDFITRLRKLQASLYREPGVLQLVVSDCPASWLPIGIKDTLSFTAPQFVITSDGFWYGDQPKNCDYTVETDFVSTDALLAVYANAKNGETVILGDEVPKRIVNG